VSAGTPPPDTSLGSIEALKRVKETESEWERKLQLARSNAKETLERLRAQSEAAVKAAQATADGARAQAVLEARRVAEREAAEILAAGTRAAEAAARPEGKRPIDQQDAIVAAVLAGFLKD
jgi:vacuolar-type H+-ATPase subunit H